MLSKRVHEIARPIPGQCKSEQLVSFADQPSISKQNSSLVTPHDTAGQLHLGVQGIGCKVSGPSIMNQDSQAKIRDTALGHQHGEESITQNQEVH